MAFRVDPAYRSSPSDSKAEEKAKNASEHEIIIESEYGIFDEERRDLP